MVELAARRGQNPVAHRAHDLLRVIAAAQDVHASWWPIPAIAEMAGSRDEAVPPGRVDWSSIPVLYGDPP